MKKMELTDFSPLQQKAILLKNTNILVSAGAGSGKTAVLIQRLFEILKSGETTLDNLLVLTFTNFAAKELKIRLKEKLAGKHETQHFAGLVEASDITTFDSFALKIVKKYSYILDLNPDISVFDNGLYNIKRRQIIEDILREKYESEDETLFSFVKIYLKNNDKDLVGLILDFDRKTGLEIDEEAFISNYVNQHYSDETFNRNINEFCLYIRDQITLMDELTQLIAHDEVRAKYEEWMLNFSALATYEDYLKVIPGLRNASLGRKIDKEEYVDDEPLLKEIKDLFKKIKALLAGGPRECVREVYDREKWVCQFVVDIYREFSNRISQFKKRYNVYTFSDIARFAYRIVSDQRVNSVIKAQYQYILVDEYQDTSDIQEIFVQAIARDNVYMVGDIKQSIYGFRNANPKIFQSKYQDYKNDKGGALLNLVDNYRSRRQVVDGVNAMLNQIMTPTYGGADYRQSHQIGVGNVSFDGFLGGQSYELDVYEYTKDDQLTNDEMEAYLVGTDIISKIKAGYQVYDQNLKSLRGARFSDFTILCRKRKFLPDYIRIFNELQIPLYTADNQDAKNSSVVQVLLSGLKLFNKVMTQTYDDDFRIAFTSFARSFVVGLDDQSIYDLIKEDSRAFLTSSLIKDMTALVEDYGMSPPSKIVEVLINRFAINDKLLTLGDVVNNRKTLLTVVEMVASLEQYDLDFAAIIDHFELYEEQEEKIEVSLTDKVDNAVTLMTIHASKGLEFSIVYFIGFYSGFNFNALSRSFKASSKYGLILPTGRVNEAKSINYYLDYFDNLKELISEEIRLLYVALTRPKEKMIILSPVSEKEYITRVASAKSPLNLLELTSYYHQHKIRVSLGERLKAPAGVKPSSYQFSLKHFSPKLEVVKQVRASRLITLNDNVDEAFLQLGTRLHRYLEVVDFATRDTRFIEDKHERTLIDRVLTMDIFQTAQPEDVYREYRYYDVDDESEAIIDLFILMPDHIKLIDYKLYHIDEDKYRPQLRVYRKHLTKVFGRRVDTYLLSIIKGQYKYINIED